MIAAMTDFFPPTSSIVLLTGAGISRESGLDTFRDAGGIWSRVRIEDVATPQAFAADPLAVNAFYNQRRARLAGGSVDPNPAHFALAALEAAWPGDFLLVTQNIDDLHERAGSRRLVHMHGELLKTRCLSCGGVHSWRGNVELASRCPGCGHAASLRPHVVWFGEMPFEMDRIYDQLVRCDLFVSIGTSGSVYPAAGFVAEARRRTGARCIELNLEPSQASHLFHDAHYGRASTVVPQFVASLLRGAGLENAAPEEKMS